MDLKAILRTTQRFVLNNSPAILTGIGVAGTVTTAVLVGKASYSAALIIGDERTRRDELSTVPTNPKDLVSNREVVELVYKEFIPAALVGTVTILAILGANHVSTKRASALAAAFKISEQMAEEYRQKIRDKMGDKAEEMARSEIAKDRIERTGNLDTLVVTGSQELYYDSWSGRPFLSTREKVQQAVNQINHQIIHQYCASLSEFYDLLDLPKTAVSDEFGWNGDEMLEIYYTSTLVDNDRHAAVEIRYNIQPFRNYFKHGMS